MRQVTISLYSFNELNEKAQQKAIREHGEFMDSISEEYENEEGEMVEEYIEHSDIEDIIDNIHSHWLIYYQ